MIKKILFVLLIGLIVIQFIHAKRNKADGIQVNNIGNIHLVPDDVKSILEKACMDCHSNNTRYPWYSNLQPVGWWMTGHINDGKKELNFDEFTNKNLRFQYHKMDETIKQVKEGEMPLNSYLWIHKDAKLSQDEKNIIINWATAIMDSMKAKYPLDSLIRKR